MTDFVMTRTEQLVNIVKSDPGKEVNKNNRDE